MLKDDQQNEIVIQAKISTLIHSEQYKLALETISKLPKNEAFLFEQAYCETQLGNPQKALDLLSKGQEKNVRAQYLMGQIFYKQGLYDKCINCYETIEKIKEETKGADPAIEDRTINITSAFIQSRLYDRVLDKKYLKYLQVFLQGLIRKNIEFR